MKTFRLIGIGLLAVLLSFSFTACSSDDDDEDDPYAPSQNESSDEDSDDVDDSNDDENYKDSDDYFTGTISGYKYVDLGLSVKWATCNIGASQPEEYGDYYAWGETETKHIYDRYHYELGYMKNVGSLGPTLIFNKYSLNTYSGQFDVDNKTILESVDDAASQRWGNKWRIPSKGEFEELIGKCKWIWISKKNIYGYKIIGPNGNSIFLPAAGMKAGIDLLNSNGFGGYWANSLEISEFYSYLDGAAWALSTYSNSYDMSGVQRVYGISVRAVTK